MNEDELKSVETLFIDHKALKTKGCVYISSDL